MNITTLNMATLDGGVIIKKGGGGTPTPPSGGDAELSPDAIVLQPNGWYWKFTDEAISSGLWANVIVIAPHDIGIRYFSGKSNKKLYGDYRDVWNNIGYYLGSQKASSECIIYAISESIGCSAAVDEQTTLVGDSVFEIINQLMPISEAELEAFMLENLSLQRITKEEYEALTTE